MRGVKVGRLLRVLRVYANKNQTVVADRIPMAVSTLSDIERGHTVPTSQSIVAIVEICGGSRTIDRMIAELQRLKDALHAIRDTDQLLYA